MRMYHHGLAVAALATAFLANAPAGLAQDKTAAAPQAAAGIGYAIQPESGMHLPVPAGWHVLKESNPDKVALFISKESIEDNGGFLTGFSLNHFPSFRANKHINPSEYADFYAKQLQTLRPEAEYSSAEVARDVLVHEVRVVDADRKPVTKLIYLIVGDDARDTLRIAWYESPASVWDAEWAHGERIVNEFLREVVRASSD